MKLHSSSTGPPVDPSLPPPKKKRNQPGNPNPDAVVVALSPKALMATNRFICEICNKGFQREQNLQLHRRGHNLPWKLKTTNQVKKKVYLCPELTCVHHDPSRALGDLTGIKKHYSRNHGKKKWKCDKCSKWYAVQSDWKAHSKTCGTREYRCDFGTLFSKHSNSNSFFFKSSIDFKLKTIFQNEEEGNANSSSFVCTWKHRLFLFYFLFSYSRAALPCIVSLCCCYHICSLVGWLDMFRFVLLLVSILMDNIYPSLKSEFLNRVVFIVITVSITVNTTNILLLFKYEFCSPWGRDRIRVKT